MHKLVEIYFGRRYVDYFGQLDARRSSLFPFWKEGWPMVQFDNAYKVLAEDIAIHYQAMLDELISLYGAN